MCQLPQGATVLPPAPTTFAGPGYVTNKHKLIHSVSAHPNSLVVSRRGTSTKPRVSHNPKSTWPAGCSATEFPPKSMSTSNSRRTCLQEQQQTQFGRGKRAKIDTHASQPLMGTVWAGGKAVCQASQADRLSSQPTCTPSTPPTVPAAASTRCMLLPLAPLEPGHICCCCRGGSCSGVT